MSPKVTAAQAMAEYVTMVEELPTRPFTFYPATLYEPVLNNKTKVLLGFSPGSFTLLRAANKVTFRSLCDLKSQPTHYYAGKDLLVQMECHRLARRQVDIGDHPHQGRWRVQGLH